MILGHLGLDLDFWNFRRSGWRFGAHWELGALFVIGGYSFRCRYCGASSVILFPFSLHLFIYTRCMLRTSPHDFTFYYSTFAFIYVHCDSVVEPYYMMTIHDVSRNRLEWSACCEIYEIGWSSWLVYFGYLLTDGYWSYCTDRHSSCAFHVHPLFCHRIGVFFRKSCLISNPWTLSGLLLVSYAR